MNKSFCFRIYPTKKQIKLFHKYLVTCVFVYNHCLDELKRVGEDYTYESIIVDFAFLKMKIPLLKGVNTSSVHLYLKNLDKSYKRYLKGKSPFPKQKNIFDISNKITIIPISTLINEIEIRDNGIWISDFGLLKSKDKKNISGRIASVTIKVTSTNKYYLSICCIGIDEIIIDKTNQCVGIDLGINHFLVMSNGNKIENPKYLAKSRRKLKRYQRQLARKEKGSHNYEMNRIKLAKTEEHVANQRRNFIHQLTNKIVKEYDVICVESLNVKKMQKDRKVSKGVHDASWSQFVRTLEYKAKLYDKKIIKVDTFFPSSQKCSVCGYINKNVKSLKIREWECPICRTFHDRDINAAKNILLEGIKKI